jgi:hypothetical protein
MRTAADIVETQTGFAVQVVCSSGWVDWPIMYSDGRVAYDAPERIPQFIRPRVRRLLRLLRRQQHPASTPAASPHTPGEPGSD